LWNWGDAQSTIAAFAPPILAILAAFDFVFFFFPSLTNTRQWEMFLAQTVGPYMDKDRDLGYLPYGIEGMD
jgi:hypothetical protein